VSSVTINLAMAEFPARGALPGVDPRAPWQSVTLAMSGFGDALAHRQILLDWFEFLGGRPAEVVYVDGGSKLATARRLIALLHEGLIDKLELLNPASWENSFHRCYIQEYQSGALATRPYICFVKPDMLPMRRGVDSWLFEDLLLLERPEVFAITTTHLIDPPTRIENGYNVYDFNSLNFSLMKRESFRSAMRGQIGELIDRGFRGEFPGHIRCEEKFRRALIEWAWQQHCVDHKLVTLARPESADWTIFHINKYGRKLLEYRRHFRARHGIEACFDMPKGLYRPPFSGIQRLGRSLEGVVRAVRRRVIGG